MTRRHVKRSGREDEADLWIGVDLGMTYTGVAYAVRGWEEPRLIQDWPGRAGQFESKVPTVLTYEGSRLSSWGFECEYDYGSNEQPKRERKWFKLLLDKEVLQRAGSKFSSKEVEKWYVDFLTELYKHIKSTMKAQRSEAWAGKVQFLFSVPTTWNPATTNLYEKLIKDAGFGKERKSHKVSVSWTEAQAAAIYTAKNLEQQFKQGDVLLICDSGGGTTDIAVLKETGDGIARLDEVDKVFGVPAGSTRIDKEFLKYAEERLTRTRVKHPELDDALADIEEIAETMMKNEFQRYKCNYGEPISKVPKYGIQNTQLSRKFSDPACDIESGKLMVSNDTMAKFFDTQLKLIFQAIDRQLERLEQSKKGSIDVDYLVLSGGLGSSVHVLNEIKKRYVEGPTAQNFHNVRKLQILRADNPRLAVVNGLVMDRTQKTTTGQSVLKSYHSRANYGFLIVEPFDSHRHRGLETFEDWDGNKYVNNQIHWVVKKGQSLSESESFKQSSTRKFKANDRHALRGWKTIVVMSQNSPENLQENAEEGGVMELCVVESDLSDFDIKSGHFTEHKSGIPGFRKVAYYSAKYDIRAFIGAAHITFEVWFHGEKCGENRTSVTWGEGASAPVSQLEYYDDL